MDKSVDDKKTFLNTLKIHNKDIDACFNDALAVEHLKQLLLSKAVVLDYCPEDDRKPLQVIQAVPVSEIEKLFKEEKL